MRNPFLQPRLIILAVLSACLIWPSTLWARQSTVPGSAESPVAHYDAGMDHWKAGRLQEALVEFQQALRLDRDYLPALTAMAELLISNSKIYEAFGVLQHAITVAPDSGKVHALLGHCFFSMRKFGEARGELHRALVLDADLTQPHFELAIIETEQGRLREARQHIETYLEHPDAERAEGLRVLASIALKMKDYDAALDAYHQWMEAEPDRTDIPRKIAGTLLTARRFAEAVERFKELAAKNPDDRHILLALFEASYKSGAYDDAIDSMQRLTQLEPQSCQPFINRARVYRMLNQPSRVLEEANQCLQYVPSHPTAHYLAGRVWFGEGELVRAKSELTRAVQADPNYVEALDWLATVEMRLGEVDSGITHAKKAESIDPSDAGVHYTLAQLYSRQRRAAEAKEQMEEFRRIKNQERWDSRSLSGNMLTMGEEAFPAGGEAGQPAEHWLSLGQYLVQVDKPQAALQALERAEQAAPADPEVQRMKAVAYTDVGEPEKALAAYAKAEELGPTALLYYGRGQIYFRLEEYEAALADLQHALKMGLPPTKAVETRVLTAAVFYRGERWSAAEAELRQALELDPRNTAARGLLGATLLKLERMDEAVAELRRAVEQNSQGASVQLILAEALIAQKNFVEAYIAIKQAAAVLGETGLVFLLRGKLAAAQGLHRAAIDQLQRVAQLPPDRQAEAFFLLGKQLLEVDRLQQAVFAFEKATITDPTLAGSWLELGKIYLDARRYESAIGYFRQAVNFAPTSGEAHYQLAVALKEAAQMAEARAAAREAKALGYRPAEELLHSLEARKTP